MRLAIVFVFLFLFACKKKECPASKEAPASTTATGIYSGRMVPTLILNKKPSGFDSLLNISGYAYNSLQADLWQPVGDYAGQFTFNNKVVPYDFNKYYLAVDSANYLSEIKNSTFSINSTTITSLLTVPSWTAASTIGLDSISRSSGFSINLNDFSNFDFVEISVSDYNYFYLFYNATKNLSGSFNVTASDLSSTFSFNQPVVIKVYVSYTDIVTVGSLKYGVTKQSLYVFPSKLIN
jgi:hypothetical protein